MNEDCSISSWHTASQGTDAIIWRQQLVAGTEKPQDFLGTLTMILERLEHDDEAAHDEELEQGMATVLLELLKSTLLVPRANSKRLRGRISMSRALRASILCTALELVFRCSDQTIKVYIEDTTPSEILPSLLALIGQFISWPESNTVMEVALNKTATVLRRLCMNGIAIEKRLVHSLLMLVKAEIPADTRIEASCALASLATRKDNKFHRAALSTIRHVSRFLVSTLTIAALSVPDDQGEKLFDALFNLACSMNVVVVNIARRTSTLRVLCRGMKAAKPEIRYTSFMIASRLLNNSDGFVELFSVSPRHGEMIILGLTTAALNATEPEMQHYLTCILTETLSNMRSVLGQIETIIDCLTLLTGAAAQERTANEAAIAICRKAPSFVDQTVLQANVFLTVIEFVQSGSTFVRHEALRALDKVCSCEASGRFLSQEGSFQLAISKSIKSNNDDEVSTALGILRKLAAESDCRGTICRSCVILDALVGTLSSKTTGSCAAYASGIDLLVLLMCDESNIVCFLTYSELLPWLSFLANSTTTKKLKKGLVDAIIRLTSAMLE